MAEPKEIHPLDEQFRKSFDELSAAPSANGWDTPSAKVWEHVQENIKTPFSSWKQWALAALGLAILSIGLFAYFQSKQTPEPANQQQTVPQEQPVVQPQINNTDAAPVVPNAAPKPAGNKSTKTTPVTTQPANQAEPLPGTSKPLPGAKKVFPNNTERNKRQDEDNDTSDENLPSKPLPKNGGGSH